MIHNSSIELFTSFFKAEFDKYPNVCLQGLKVIWAYCSRQRVAGVPLQKISTFLRESCISCHDVFLVQLTDTFVYMVSRLFLKQLGAWPAACQELRKVSDNQLERCWDEPRGTIQCRCLNTTISYAVAKSKYCIWCALCP